MRLMMDHSLRAVVLASRRDAPRRAYHCSSEAAACFASGIRDRSMSSNLVRDESRPRCYQLARAILQID